MDEIESRVKRRESLGCCQWVVKCNGLVHTTDTSGFVRLEQAVWEAKASLTKGLMHGAPTYSAVTCPAGMPKAQMQPTAPLSCCSKSPGYLLKSLCMRTLTFSTPMACLTGRLESTETFEMVEDAMHRARTADPAVPVQPVKMM